MNRVTRVRSLSIVVGASMLIIGLRFILLPEAASNSFGVKFFPNHHELTKIIGFRDIWVGAMLLAFAYFKEWRAIGIWFLCATAVCVLDAFVVSQSTAKASSISFHLACGILCMLLARGAFIIHRSRV